MVGGGFLKDAKISEQKELTVLGVLFLQHAKSEYSFSDTMTMMNWDRLNK